ncbi:MAG TPA: MipA/OmpV family protein [Rhizomicrobium sp.]|nr:MipA/OmpV family protein [Rhizomicrobium sp.]
MKFAHIVACAILFSCWLPLAVLAAPKQEAPKDWEVTLGAGAGMRPTFEGSDRYTVRPLPVLSVTWRDTISLGEGGLSAYWHRKRFRIGAGLTFDAGRKDHSSGGIFESGDDRLKGLGTINAALGLRGFASYRLGPVNFDLSATKFTGRQNDGIVASLGASAPLPLTKQLVVMPHVHASWANGNAMQTYFGVTAAQASASIFPRFNAGSGLRDVRGGVNIIYRLSPRWFVAGDASVTRLMGDAARSPISISDTNVMVTTMIGYRF